MVAATAVAILPFIFQLQLMITSLRLLLLLLLSFSLCLCVFLSDSYFVHLGLTTISGIPIWRWRSFVIYAFFFGLFYLMCRCHDQYQDKGISNMNIMNTIHLQSTQQSSYQSIATKYGMRVRKTKIHSTDEKNVIALGSTIWLKLQNKQKQQKIFA